MGVGICISLNSITLYSLNNINILRKSTLHSFLLCLADLAHVGQFALFWLLKKIEEMFNGKRPMPFPQMSKECSYCNQWHIQMSDYQMQINQIVTLFVRV